MPKKTQPMPEGDVDKGLVALFLSMSPEERMAANDNAVRAILELRDAYRRRKDKKHGSKRPSGRPSEG